jgi:hypothetical protein
MIKESASWSKDETPNLIGRKKVDWSIFNDGSTIPIEFHEEFENANNHFHIERGQRRHLVLLYENKEFDAHLRNVDRKVKSDTLQILFGKDLKEYLKQVFVTSYDYLNQNRIENQKNYVAVPDELAEYINFYETEEPFKYRMEFISKADVPEEKPEVDHISDKELVKHIVQYIQNKGFYYDFDEVMNLFLSLKTKPFVILSGISGTGKTMMVKWFAESLGATRENGRFNLIPVRPDWSDGSDLLGYRDIKGDFIPGPLTKVLKQANKDLHNPYFVLLDEMNLARVEYYFSDLLSVMESREWIDGKLVTHSVLPKETISEELGIPDNVYIIGTVNMDETTFPFSKKVLDRANTIEFNRVELSNFSFLEDNEEIDPINIDNKNLTGKFLHLKDAFQENKELIIRVTNELVTINSILEKIRAHVGYRVRDEICFYMIYNQRGQLMGEYEAFDYLILQKILPRLSGSDHRIFSVLRELFTYCTGNSINYEQFKDLKRELEGAKYGKSASKLAEMIRRYNNDEFTSFWVGG